MVNRTRGGILSVITRVENYLRDFTELDTSFSGTRGVLQSQLELVETMRKKYAEVQESIISEATSESARAQEMSARQAVFVRCDMILEQLTELIESCPEEEANSKTGESSKPIQSDKSEILDIVKEIMAQSNKQYRDQMKQHKEELQLLLSSLGTQSSSNTKLPQLNLPTFDGRYSQWMTFKDRFTSAVINHPKVTPVQKLDYLKSSLTGDALSQIKNLTTTGANFFVAWDILIDKYERKGDIVADHIHNFYNMPRVTASDKDAIHRISSIFGESIMALDAMDVSQRDPWVIEYTLCRLDSESKVLWGRVCGKEIPTITQFKEFLEQRCRDAKNANPEPLTKPSSSRNPPAKQTSSNKRQVTALHNATTNSDTQCRCCQNGSHPLYQCPKFLSLSATERFDIVKRLSLCRNCIGSNHLTISCTYHKCRKCQGRHNILLHEKFATTSPPNPAPTDADVPPTSNQDPPRPAPPAAVSSATTCCSNQTAISPRVFLATATVDILSADRERFPCRMMLDSGAQVCLMTTNLYQKLKLQKIPSDISIIGVGNNQSKVRHRVMATISSRVSNASFTFDCYILPKITGNVPSWLTDTKEIVIPPEVELADPSWADQGPIDLLVCGDAYWSSFLTKTINLGPGLPHLRETVFGYVVVGEHHHTVAPQTCHNLSVTTLEDSLRRFWEVEDWPDKSRVTDEHEAAEKHFMTTHKRTPEGRFVVELPFRDDPNSLGESRPQAIRQFLGLEKKFDKNPTLKTLYSEVMDDHMKRGWLEPVPDDDIFWPSYYMPHHGVLKESTTTKLRVVYNASAKSSSGRSLNDILMIGPTVQPTLATILLRFRRYPYAITSDISKMYLQLAMDPVHSNYQRLIWRDSRDGPVRDYRITRVCFGVASSPFLATRALIQLADENEAEFPRAAEALRTSFYVDDCILSAPTLNAASETQTQLIEVLKRGGFELAKWSSNDPSLLPTPLNSQETSSVFIGETTSSALGLSWDSSADVFQFKSPVVPSDDLNTKRKMASTIAKLFDPIGLVGPIIVEAKILLQDIHELKLGWDKIVPDEFQEKWRSFVDRLKDINQIRIPRWISTIHSPTKVEIHAFCDASMRAYGTAIYIVTRDDSDGVSANLLLSKSRVAPIAQLTMPRLELCAAVLATETVEKMKDVFQPATIHFWSDSTIVLCWIHRPPVAQGVFVSNRIRNILKLSTIDQWRHVVTDQNPADIISRGMSPQQLTHCDLWWKGPPWLSKSVDDWPPIFHPSGLQPEEPSCLVLTQEWPHHGTLFEHLSAKYSSLPKILRIVVYCLRFTRGARDPQRMSKGPITSVEMELARSFLIGQEQRAQWPGLPNHIHKNSVSSSKWKSLASLTPFIDEDGLIRVGGRIKNSDEAFAAKHPILLPKSKLSLMILRHEHLKQLHAGPTLLLASIRQRYWPLSGRNLTRRVVHECYQCFRAKPKPLEQLMGDLPEHRVNFYRPFQATGVDFAGPVQMLSTASRGIRARRAQVQKAYIAIFVCMATKATHLELVTALSTDAFLACFRRFAARRTMPRHMHSDCGKNFEGANNELSRLLREELHQREIITATHDEGIVWNFNPPASPHHGGLWEACVKSTKFHLSRVTQSHPLCYEELSTLLCQIECILNSRPICALSNDPNDPKYLTPGHFLVGVPSNAPPDPNLAQIPANRLSYWQACQSRVQEFGRKWRLHYLNTLQQRTRWRVDQENLTTGTVVLLLDETNREGSKWVLGRIENIHPGADGRVRVVTIRTARGTYRRPITKIAKIPEADDNSSGVSTSRQTGEDVPAFI